MDFIYMKLMLKKVLGFRKIEVGLMMMNWKIEMEIVENIQGKIYEK